LRDQFAQRRGSAVEATRRLTVRIVGSSKFGDGRAGEGGIRAVNEGDHRASR
jgi:hypothetical protein